MDYTNQLADIASALEIEGASVLALTGNYEALAAAIESANKNRGE